MENFELILLENLGIEPSKEDNEILQYSYVFNKDKFTIEFTYCISDKTISVTLYYNNEILYFSYGNNLLSLSYSKNKIVAKTHSHFISIDLNLYKVEWQELLLKNE